MEKVDKLRKERDDALEEAQKLETLLSRFNLQLDNSGSLTSSLENEYKRWSENVTSLTNQINNLVGDIFLAAAVLSYNSPFTGV